VTRTDAASARQHVAAILLLPFMNTMVIPTILVAVGPTPRWPADAAGTAALAAGVALTAAGAALVAHTISLFVRIGRGTLAPWCPTRALITTGIYGRCRNPMKTGLFVVLLGEALALRSAPIFYWLACFALVNTVYIRVYEEPNLKQRFGAAYRDYCSNVPRWWPRLTRWHPSQTVGDTP
jgi:protein-S-isoprenylcysteine O-methyltransferase Ste14